MHLLRLYVVVLGVLVQQSASSSSSSTSGSSSSGSSSGGSSSSGAGPTTLKITCTVTLPPHGEVSSLGSLFEVRSASSGELVAHAGTQYATGTFYAAPTTELNFWVNATDAPAAPWSSLGKPFPEAVSETRLVPVGGELYAINKQVPEHKKNIARLGADGRTWTRVSRAEAGGIDAFGGAVEACGGTMVFERLGITMDGQWIWDIPGEFTHMYGHYHNGHVLIIAMTSYSYNAIIVGTYSCGDTALVVTKRFSDPVSHALQPRNFPYAWVEVADGFLVATNLGFVYLASPAKDELQVLKSHAPNASWQPYTFIRWYNETLLGQYPSGTVFSYDDRSQDVDPFLPQVNPEPGASSMAREAQSLAIYDGQLMLGVWPWGTVHRKAPARGAPWLVEQRLFSNPPIDDQADGPWIQRLANTTAGNQWGQRVSGLKLFNGSLYAATSAKNPITDDLYRGLLPAEAEAEYGAIHRLDVANEAGGRALLKPGQTTVVFEFELAATGLTLRQDGVLIGSKPSVSPLHLPVGKVKATSCTGIYGPCAPGVRVELKLELEGN